MKYKAKCILGVLLIGLIGLSILNLTCVEEPPPPDYWWLRCDENFDYRKDSFRDRREVVSRVNIACGKFSRFYKVNPEKLLKDDKILITGKDPEQIKHCGESTTAIACTRPEQFGVPYIIELPVDEYNRIDYSSLEHEVYHVLMYEYKIPPDQHHKEMENLL